MTLNHIIKYINKKKTNVNKTFLRLYISEYVLIRLLSNHIILCAGDWETKPNELGLKKLFKLKTHRISRCFVYISLLSFTVFCLS